MKILKKKIILLSVFSMLEELLQLISLNGLFVVEELTLQEDTATVLKKNLKNLEI